MTATPTAPAGTVDANLRAALSARSRPPRPNALTATLAFGWRMLLKIKHIPEQLMEAIAIPVVFTLMFTYLFGGALAGSTGEYLRFILPGTLVMAVLLVTMYVGLGLHVDLGKGVFDRFRSLPVWRPAPLAGLLVGEAARFLLAGGLVIALGLVMGFRDPGGVAGVFLALGLVLLFALSLSWAWIVLALVVRTPNTIMSIAMVVVFPLASNVFARPETMPGWLEAFVDVNPVSHVVTAERGLMDGTATVAQVGWVLVACAGLTAIFAPLAIRLYNRKE